MKNKNNQNFINQANQKPQNFYKNRANQYYQKNNYYQNYKPNITKNNPYYDKNYRKENYDYLDNHGNRPQENRWNYKKKNWYNNYKKYNGLDYDEDEDYLFSQYSERNSSPFRNYNQFFDEYICFAVK